MGFTEEYLKIVECVLRYGIHYPMIKFTCKKVTFIFISILIMIIG